MKLEEKFKPLENYKAINWNEVSDMIDKATWEKLTEPESPFPTTLTTGGNSTTTTVGQSATSSGD